MPHTACIALHSMHPLKKPCAEYLLFSDARLCAPSPVAQSLRRARRTVVRFGAYYSFRDLDVEQPVPRLQLASKLLIITNGVRPNILADSRSLHCRIPSLVPIFPWFDMPYSYPNVYFMGNNHKCTLFQDADPLPKTVSLLP